MLWILHCVYISILLTFYSSSVISINGGENVPPRDMEYYCYQAAVFCVKYNVPKLICSGAIVRPNIVLTSANCTEKIYDIETNAPKCDRAFVRLGTVELSAGGVDRDIIKHKAPEIVNFTYIDLDLLKLNESIPRNNVNICQIEVAKNIDHTDEGDVVISGYDDPYGSNNIKKQWLRSISIPVVNREKCNETLWRERRSRLAYANFCFGEKDLDRYTNENDDGAPVIYRDDNQNAVLIGVDAYRLPDYDDLSSAPLLEYGTRVGLLEYWIMNEIVEEEVNDSHYVMEYVFVCLFVVCLITAYLG